MAKAAVATQSVDFEAIDRLEQKLKMLVTVLDRTRARHHARATRRTPGCAPSSTRPAPASPKPKAPAPS